MITAYVGATVIDGSGRDAIPDAVIAVADGRVMNVFRRGESPIPESWKMVDVSKKYIVPGLIESHTHIAGLADDSYVKVSDQTSLVDLWMREYVRHGVTTVRDTGNSDPESALALCRQGRDGWPRFFGAGPVLDGPADPAAPWKWLFAIDDEDSARRTVAQLVKKGVDFIKVYVWMRPSVMRAVVEEAHRLGVAVAAHVGHVVTVEQAVKLGVDALEHVRMGPELLGPTDYDRYVNLNRRALDPLANYRSWRYADPTSDAADRLIALMAERAVFWTPTLTWSRSILGGDLPEVVNPPGVEVVPDEVREQWKNYVYYFDYSPDDFNQAKVELRRQMEFVGRALKGGVRVTAGTDASNPSVVPGASLHDELALLVESGLTPMDAIVAATSRAAENLQQQAEIGTIEKSKRADFVVLDSNPVSDIRNTRAISAVVKDGTVVQGQSTNSPEVRAG